MFVPILSAASAFSTPASGGFGTPSAFGAQTPSTNLFGNTANTNTSGGLFGNNNNNRFGQPNTSSGTGMCNVSLFKINLFISVSNGYNWHPCGHCTKTVGIVSLSRTF